MSVQNVQNVQNVQKAVDPYAAAYTFRDWYIPVYMMGGIKQYVEKGVRPGSFLTAIITNNLKEAVYAADDVNIANIPAYISFFYNEVPGQAWGSKEKMEAWMEKKIAEREEG